MREDVEVLVGKDSTVSSSAFRYLDRVLKEERLMSSASLEGKVES